MAKVKHHILEEIEEEKKELRGQIALTALTGLGLLVAIVSSFMGAAPLLTLLGFIVAYLAGGLPAGKEALKALFSGSLDINLLMVLAALAAAGVGEPRDGAILLFLFSLAGTLEHYAMGNTKRSVAALMDLRPDEANRQLSGEKTERVAVEELTIHDLVVVRPGERVPVDGEIIRGEGAVNQSPITGESVPVDKVVGDQVFAGTVNQNAVLVIKVTSEAAHSTLSRMIELVTEAQAKRSPSERFGDWFGQRYTIAVLVGSIIALGVFLLLGIETSEAFYKAATLLVVASPCAIVISVPAAVLSALATAARNGILFKGGAALEDFSHITTMALDKTGTLTSGTMAVASILVYQGSRESLISLAATIESQSNHPLAKSVVSYASESGIVFSQEQLQAENLPGRGLITTLNGKRCWAGNRALVRDCGVVIEGTIEADIAALEARGETPIIIGCENNIVGVIALSDSLRPHSQAALIALREAGIKRLVMLTGDSPVVARAVGEKLDLKSADIFGSLLPEDKVREIEELGKHGEVAFVGDGVNDAAALSTARVGIAMGVAGSDVALEAADVALLSDDLRQLSYAYTLSKQTNRIIKQNLIFACGIMAVMVVTTLFFYLPLPLGVIGHEGGTLLVVVNGLRLLFARNKSNSAA